MNLNKITFNEQLSLQAQTEQPIRAFASQANTIEVLAPVSEYNTAYIVLQGLKDSVVNPKLRQTQRLYMSRLSDSGVYRRWNMVIPGAILNDISLMNSTGVRVKVEFWYIEGDHLGVEKYNTTNAATIASNLATDYPSAEDGQFVRVIDTNTDWVYDLATTTWEDYGTQKLVGISNQQTESVDFTLEQGTYTDEPTHAPTNTELILQELGAALKKAGGVMTGDIDMDANDILNVGGIILYSATGTAVLKYDGTDLILNRNAVDESVLTELTTLDELYNVIETAIADDDILIRSGANYVNVSKADFLQAVTDRLTTNEQDIDNLELANMFKTVTYNSTNGVMTFTKYDNTTTTIDLPLELIIESGSYDEVGNDLVFILANGNEIRVPVDNLLTDIDARNVRYDNTESGLTATKVKDAIDEVASKKIDKDFSNYVLDNDLELDDEIIVRDVSTNQTKKTTLDYLNFIGQSIIEYGVRFNLTASSPTGERVKKVDGVMIVDGETNATDLHSLPAASINGVGSNSFDSIFRTSLVEEFNVNGDGNTFTRIQPYFLKQEIVNDGTNTYLYYWACLTKLDGYRTPLPFLQSDGSVSYYDIGHEEGVVDANGRLRSITDEDFPTVSINRGAFRTAARKNDGDGTNVDSKYQITDIAEYNDLIQIPMMIEFATKNLQSIFRGHVDSTYDADTVADGASVAGSSTAIVSNADGANFPIGQGVYISTDSKLHTITNIEVDTPIAGQTTITFDGDAVAILTGANLDPRQWNTGNFKNAKYHSCYYSSSIADGKQPFMWRYIVNPYGNQWKFVDGVKIVDWQAWIATSPADYDDAGSVAGEYASPFIKLNYVHPQVNGYAKELGFDARYPFAQLPVDNSGSSSTYYSDYYYQVSGDRTALVGGVWSNVSSAGPFYWGLNYSFAAADVNIGARLSKRP